MYGMPFAQALVFAASVIVLVAATQRRQLHPFFVIVIVAAAFGYIAGFTTSQLGGVFGGGFSERVYTPGLVIVVSGLVSALAETTTASARLAAVIARWDRSPWRGAKSIAAVLGLVAGTGASVTAAFALVSPLLSTIGGEAGSGSDTGGDNNWGRQRASTVLALAASGSHGLLVLSPLPIAALAILGADWQRVAWFGIPIALVLALFACWYGSRLPIASAPAREARPAITKQSPGSAVVLLMAVLIPLALLIVQSIGDIPSEPLGGGPRRELILGAGRPLILFLVSFGAMAVGHWWASFGKGSDPDWSGRALASLSGTLLTVCAAGGFQRLCQETGMADLIGEHLLVWHFGAASVLIPFLLAAVLKTLQGSSMVAAITATGMVQPLLAGFGLGDANGKALAALAVGIGAVTVSHVNDEYFWLVTRTARLSPLQGLGAVSLGTLLQGILAAALLVLLALAISHG